VVVSRSPLSRLPAQKGHPVEQSRGASGSRGNNRHRQTNADWDRNVLGVGENIEQDIALSRARDTTVDLRNQLPEGQTPACDPPDLRRVL
jgi:hypothetical protein